MIGREAYHDPWTMADWDARFLGLPARQRAREDIEAQMVEYLERLHLSEHHWSQASRHMLGLWNGVKGARRWRQVWSDHKMKTLAPAEVSRLAHEAPRSLALPAPEGPAAYELAEPDSSLP